jgi:urease accessory protein
MQIIDRVARLTDQDTAVIIDRVALTWEQRYKSRQKLVTRQGREIALALPTGTRLQAGDLLPTADGCIAVELAVEDVLRICPRSLQEAAFVAYHIGNRHLPLEIDAETLKTPYDAGLESYLVQLGLAVERMPLPFTPVSALSGPRHL